MIAEEYFRMDIELVLLYIMKYSSSDSFVDVLNQNFIEPNWDMSAFDIGSKNQNFPQLGLSHRDGISQLSSSSVTTS